MKSKRTITSLLLTLCALLLLCQCSSVTTTQPLTSKPKAIDKEKFEGTWLVDGKGNSLQVKFDDNGIAQIAALEWKDGHFEIETMEMTVAEKGEYKFISLRAKEKGQWMKNYYFAQYKFTEQGDLIVWLPDSKAFENAIKEKLLSGKIKPGKYTTDVNISSDANTLLKLISGSKNSELFDYQTPIILRKIASPKD
ncbi:MAG: hypothetical protein QM496_09625 [Verrucomicrobiota bacterium]